MVDKTVAQDSVKVQPLNRPLFEDLVAREKEGIEALAETKGRVSGPSGAVSTLGHSTIDSGFKDQDH